MTTPKDERSDVTRALEPIDRMIEKLVDAPALWRQPAPVDVLREARDRLAKHLAGFALLPGWRCHRCYGFFNGAEKETLSHCRSCGLPKEECEVMAP